jgi:hypothetical protein
MSKSPALSNIRIIPRETEYLDRKLGARGEVFFDQAGNTLRLYDGQTSGGIALLKADLSNLEVQISSVILSDTPPANVESGTIWVETSTLKLYVYYSDGSGTQWVQPTTPSYGSGGGTGGATAVVDLTDVAISNPTSGQVLKYNGTEWVNSEESTGGGGGGGATTLDQLTDVVLSSPTTNQINQYKMVNHINK